jgi:hypothetical protein
MMRTLRAMNAKLRSSPVAGNLLAGSVGSIEIGVFVLGVVAGVVVVVVVVVVAGTGINAAIHT